MRLPVHYPVLSRPGRVRAGELIDTRDGGQIAMHVLEDFKKSLLL